MTERMSDPIARQLDHPPAGRDVHRQDEKNEKRRIISRLRVRVNAAQLAAGLINGHLAVLSRDGTEAIINSSPDVRLF
jgi:hypothetical protein